MNAKQFLELLKNLQKMMKCPSCGAAYKVEEVQFLGHVEGLFLLQMVCGECDLPVSMNFMASKGMSKKPILMSDVDTKERKTKINSEISSNELIDFHQFLEKFRGDFKKFSK
ncbi:hypothetical protein COY62_03010 [bacterium (Candidatus Howlettbacteria) CG_4_10_14_0_8_um_filter_40_9]|nr:MAG: hypothetical protein COY62_03010 [bacterium (Candidatus Howlettbacteria) CG_4_10_14_0_8_um_filter_40_9]